jgi:hypothetical protein
VGRSRGVRHRVDPELVKLRGALSTRDPEAKQRAREALEAYQRERKITEAKRVLAEERKRVLVAAGLDPDEDET